MSPVFFYSIWNRINYLQQRVCVIICIIEIKTSQIPTGCCWTQHHYSAGRWLAHLYILWCDVCHIAKRFVRIEGNANQMQPEEELWLNSLRGFSWWLICGWLICGWLITFPAKLSLPVQNCVALSLTCHFTMEQDKKWGRVNKYRRITFLIHKHNALTYRMWACSLWWSCSLALVQTCDQPEASSHPYRDGRRSHRCIWPSIVDPQSGLVLQFPSCAGGQSGQLF